MCSLGRSAHNFQDADATNDEGVCHERAMAAPRHSFSAHERGGAVRSELDRAVEPARELGRLHVVRETAEARVAPGKVDRIGFRMTQAAEFLEMNVANSGGVERCRERIAVELGIMAGLRNRADVDDLPDAVRAEELDKFTDLARGVPDGEDGQRLLDGRRDHRPSFHHSVRIGRYGRAL